MESKLRRCACCGTEYKFCPKCNEDKDKPMFYFTFCSENCKEIYMVTSQYENGQISSNDAKTQLDKLDLSKLDKFGISYKNSIGNIMSYVGVGITPIIVEKNGENIVENQEEVKVDEPVEESVLKDVLKNIEQVDNYIITEEEKSIKKPKTRRVRNVE